MWRTARKHNWRRTATITATANGCGAILSRPLDAWDGANGGWVSLLLPSEQLLALEHFRRRAAAAPSAFSVDALTDLARFPCSCCSLISLIKSARAPAVDPEVYPCRR